MTIPFKCVCRTIGLRASLGRFNDSLATVSIKDEDLSWIDVPVLGARGEPVHWHGITDVPGMYFIGLQWLSKMVSSFLSGVGDDAARLADHIAGRNRVAA